MSREFESFRYAVCGLGPAGIGYLCACYRSGLLPDMVSQGLLMIDTKANSGGGALQHYKITANTTAATFLECMDGDHADIFGDLNDQQAELIQKLRSANDQPVDLKIAGALLQLIGDKILEYAQQLGARWMSNASVQSIVVDADRPAYDLQVHDKTSDTQSTIRASNVMLNFGAEQQVDAIKGYLTQQFGDIGEAMSDKLLLADDLLRTGEAALTEQVQQWRNLLILGSSHSSMSVVERVVSLAKSNSDFTVGLLYRSPIRLFYGSAEEAHKDNYKFDAENDICPLSGGVNRFGGLRFAAKRIGAQILNYASAGTAIIPVELLQLDKLSDKQLLQKVQAADFVVPCIGYSPCQPPILDTRGEPIPIAMDGFGYKVSEIGELYAETGDKLAGLYSFGIGAGQRSSPEVGGEKSFRKRVDGVWLYHFDIGQKVAQAVYKQN